MAKRKRDIQLKFRVTPQEREMIETKMAQFGTTNMAAYLRKMAIDGYVVKLDLPELRELVSLLRYSSNNLNQLTKLSHQRGFHETHVYVVDLLRRLKEILGEYRQASYKPKPSSMGRKEDTT